MSEQQHKRITEVAEPNNHVCAGRIDLEDGSRQLIITRSGDAVRVFLNSCPHRGVRLDWIPGRFLDESACWLQCSTHGALFEPSSGKCVEGPCRGRHLIALDAQERTDGIYVDVTSPIPHSALIGRG